MSNSSWKSFAWAVVAVISVGCGEAAKTAPRAAADATPDASESTVFLLRELPVDARPVGDVRASATDGGDVTILGRIGGGVDPWVEGRAAFTIVDPKLEPCKPDEGCPTPWDYCCSTDQLPANRALIKFVDGAGDTVGQDARKLLGLKELQTVVVKGTAKRDKAGNLTVLASGVYVVPDAN